MNETKDIADSPCVPAGQLAARYPVGVEVRDQDSPRLVGHLPHVLPEQHSLLLQYRPAAELGLRSLGELGGLGQDGLQLCDEGQEIVRPVLLREVHKQLLLRPDLDVVVDQDAVDSGCDQACTCLLVAGHLLPCEAGHEVQQLLEKLVEGEIES
jgi:hypothetical protein